MGIRLKKLMSITMALILTVVLLPVFTVPVFAAEYWESWTELTTTAGQTLSGNYKVTSNKTISNTSTGGSGLIINGIVTIYINSGCTLTVSGGAGSGTTGGGAAIRLPSGATLILRGGGTLAATGGKAGNGITGSTGGAGSHNTTTEYYTAGYGGAGGAGGGGAGAGIGTNGASGGSGASTTSSRGAIYTTDGNAFNGYSGNSGYGGANSGAVGILYVLDTVSVTGTGGSAGSSGSTASNGAGAYHAYQRRWFVGGGGGGGGGAAGGSGTGIGSGGYGGGGGGAGGSGGYNYNSSNSGASNPNGGAGQVGSSTSAGSAGTASNYVYNIVGGTGGAGGGNGGKGSSGTVYKTSSATVTGASATSTPTTYSITYNANGGSLGSVPSTQAKYSGVTEYITDKTPTRTGFSFVGWNTSSSATTANYSANAAYSTNGSLTLYAVWKANTYTVTLNANGGTNGTTTQVTASYNSDMPTIATANLPTRTGYTLVGLWDTSAASGGKQYYNGTGASANIWDKTTATTLYARWTANTYTITLDNQSGTGGSGNQTVTYGSQIPSSVAVPTRNGYVFGGYYTGTNGTGTKYYNANGTRAYTNNWSSVSGITLYAYWSQNAAISGTVVIEYTYGKGLSVPENTRADSAEVILWRKTTGNFTEVATQMMGFNTAGDSDTKNYSFANQPQIDGSGNAYTYKVTVELSNYDTTYNGNNVTLSFNPNNFDAPFEITPIGVGNPPAVIDLRILWREGGNTGQGQIISQHADVYVEAHYDSQTKTYRGSYPVWKLDPDNNPYEYQIILLSGQGLANIQYGDWIKWNGTSANGTMTARFESKKQTAINDSTGDSNFVVSDQSNLDTVLDRIISSDDAQGDKIVTLELNVSDNAKAAEVEAIKTVAGSGSEVYFFDATLVKTVDGSPETISNVPVPVEIRIKLEGDLANKTYYRVYRYHGNKADMLSNDTTKVEHFIVDVQNSEIVIHTMKFSTYAIFGNDSPLNMSEGYEVDVQAKITGEGGAVYKIDIAWGAMTFEYSTSGVWDAGTHSYTDGSTAVGWMPSNFHDGNNQITTWNHSNGDVMVSFTVTPEADFEAVTMTVHQGNSPDSFEALNVLLGKVPSQGAEAESIKAYLWLEGAPSNIGTLKENYTKIAVITATIATTNKDQLTPVY